MFSVLAPVFLLLAFLSLPCIWMLHRFVAKGKVVSVSRVHCWSADQVVGGAGMLQSKADGIWVLRALIVFLLLLVLSKPFLKGSALSGVEVPQLTIWLDESPSMFTIDRDTELSRLAMAIDQVEAWVKDRPVGSVMVRSLRHPREITDFSQYNPAFSEANTFVSAVADPRRVHWLVTDGNSKAVENWARDQNIGKVHYVGSSQTNLGIRSAALRRQLSDPSTVLFSAQLDLKAGSSQLQSRELVLSMGEEVLHRQTFPVDDTTARTVTAFFKLPAETEQVIASILPNDSAPWDDTLSIPILNSALFSVFIAACPEVISELIQRSPRYQVVLDQDSPLDIYLECAGREKELGPQEVFELEDRLKKKAAATIVFATGALSTNHANKGLRWKNEVGHLANLPVDPSWFSYLEDFTPWEFISKAELSPVLSLGEHPIIVEDADNKNLWVLFDIFSPTLQKQAVYPLFLSGLLDYVSGVSESSFVDYGEAAFPTVDLTVRRYDWTPEEVVADPSLSQSRLEDFSPKILLLLMLLLGIEIFLLLKATFCKGAQGSVFSLRGISQWFRGSESLASG